MLGQAYNAPQFTGCACKSQGIFYTVYLVRPVKCRAYTTTRHHCFIVPCSLLTAKSSEAAFYFNLENAMNRIKNRIIGVIIVFVLAVNGYTTASATSVLPATTGKPD